jgi:hypothetical protein
MASGEDLLKEFIKLLTMADLEASIFLHIQFKRRP